MFSRADRRYWATYVRVFNCVEGRNINSRDLQMFTVICNCNKSNFSSTVKKRGGHSILPMEQCVTQGNLLLQTCTATHFGILTMTRKLHKLATWMCMLLPILNRSLYHQPGHCRQHRATLYLFPLLCIESAKSALGCAISWYMPSGRKLMICVCRNPTPANELTLLLQYFIFPQIQCCCLVDSIVTDPAEPSSHWEHYYISFKVTPGEEQRPITLIKLYL